MNNVVTKIVVAFVLLGLCFLGTFYMYLKIGLLKGIEETRVSLDQLPKELGPWKGEDRKTDDRMFRATQAEQVISRGYTDAAGKTVTLHMAAYFRFWYDVPHSPLVCYPSSGWTTVRTTIEDVPMPDAPPLKAAFALFEMEGRHEMILFWYQLGDHTFSDGQGLHDAQQALRDRSQWPSLVKVLLSTDASNSELAKRRLIEFASRLYEWSSQIQNGPASATPPKPADASPAPREDATSRSN